MRPRAVGLQPCGHEPEPLNPYYQWPRRKYPREAREDLPPPALLLPVGPVGGYGAGGEPWAFPNVYGGDLQHAGGAPAAWWAVPPTQGPPGSPVGLAWPGPADSQEGGAGRAGSWSHPPRSPPGSPMGLPFWPGPAGGQQDYSAAANLVIERALPTSPSRKSPPPPPEERKVMVHTLGGESLEVMVYSGAIARTLMEMVDDAWHIPCIFQKLVHGCRVLYEDEKVEHESYHLQVTTDRVDYALNSPSQAERIQAVRDLKRFSAKGRSRGFPALLRALDNDSTEVRKLATDTWVSIVLSGDEGVIDGAARSLEDASLSARKAAISVLTTSAPTGNRNAIALACSKMEDSQPEVRIAALRAFCNLSEPGDRRAISEVCRVLAADATDTAVVQVALSLLATLACKGDDGAVRAACGRLEDRSEQVREAALRALRTLAAKGHRQAVRMVCDRLADERAAVRKLALLVLPVITDRGDEAVIAAVRGRQLDERSDVRHAALLALAQVTAKLDPGTSRKPVRGSER